MGLRWRISLSIVKASTPQLMKVLWLDRESHTGVRISMSQVAQDKDDKESRGRSTHDAARLEKQGTLAERLHAPSFFTLHTTPSMQLA